MKRRLWLLHLPILFLASLAFFAHEGCATGRLRSAFVQKHVFPSLRSFSSLFTDLKFRVRGPRSKRAPIAIVEIDSASLDKIGRWPWRRDYVALLLQKIFDQGAKVVGLDILFSEADPQVSDDLAELLRKKGMGKVLPTFETDPYLSDFIRRHRDHLVLSWASEATCQPLFDSLSECPVGERRFLDSHPVGFARYSLDSLAGSAPLFAERTPLISVVTSLIGNIPLFSEPSQYQGFTNGFRDPDGALRRAPLVAVVAGKAHGSFPLMVASVALGKRPAVGIEESQLLSSLHVGKRAENVNPLGVMEINYRGPSRTFPYVSALELFKEGDPDPKIQATLKDSVVLVGASALALADIAATPFDAHMPGVEVHANVLDNLMSGDALRSSSCSLPILLFLMIFGALGLVKGAQHLEAKQEFLLFAACTLLLFSIDNFLLFRNGENWNTGFLSVELVAVMFVSLAIKYVVEERDRKFLRAAFAKYVAPALVDSIVKDNTVLALGGKKQRITTLFCDIRGFTAFAETRDAKIVSQFLNDYFGLMTEIVFSRSGTLDKYVGDGLMAFWGAPLEDPKHATHAMEAAIEMVRAVEQNRARFLDLYGIELHVGIGIQSGVVSVGNMGSERTFNYTVIGNDVNVTVRLEEVTKQFHTAILTTEATLAAVLEQGLLLPHYRSLGEITMRGQQHPTEVVEVLAHPLCPEALELFAKALSHFKAGEWEAAYETFRAVQTLVPNDGPSGYYLAECLSRTQKIAA